MTAPPLGSPEWVEQVCYLLNLPAGQKLHNFNVTTARGFGNGGITAVISCTARQDSSQNHKSPSKQRRDKERGQLRSRRRLEFPSTRPSNPATPQRTPVKATESKDQGSTRFASPAWSSVVSSASSTRSSPSASSPRTTSPPNASPTKGAGVSVPSGPSTELHTASARPRVEQKRPSRPKITRHISDTMADFARGGKSPPWKSSQRNSPLATNNEGVNPRKVSSSPVTDSFMSDLQWRLPIVAMMRAARHAMCSRSNDAHATLNHLIDSIGQPEEGLALFTSLADFLLYARQEGVQ